MSIADVGRAIIGEKKEARKVVVQCPECNLEMYELNPRIAAGAASVATLKASDFSRTDAWNKFKNIRGFGADKIVASCLRCGEFCIVPCGRNLWSLHLKDKGWRPEKVGGRGLRIAENSVVDRGADLRRQYNEVFAKFQGRADQAAV